MTARNTVSINQQKKVTLMKKTMCLALAVMMAVCAACASADILYGGWQAAESPELTEERTAVFETAIKDLVGVNYVPVAYLGSQVVAGTNHCFLCKATVVYPNAVPSYTLVYFHEDLEGNATIMQSTDIDIAALSAPAE